MKKRNNSIETGLQGAAFGVSESVVMMLGVLYALAVTGDRKIIVLGILASGIADAFANSSAFHISEEAEGIHSRPEIWKATLFCFLGTAIPVGLFLIPLFSFSVIPAILIDGIIGLILLSLLGFYVGRCCKKHASLFHIVEYVAIGIIVPIICYSAGSLIIKFF